MKELFQNLIELYKNVDIENPIDDENTIEVRYVEAYLNVLKWEELSDYEKQSKRRDLLSRLMAASKLTDGESTTFKKLRYENIVIEEYDALISLEKQMKTIMNPPKIVLRLKGMIILEKRAIDKRLSFKGISHLPIGVFKNIFRQMKGQNIRLEKVENLESILQKIHEYIENHAARDIKP